MARMKISEQDWECFLRVGDQLGVDVRDLLKRDVRFHVLESAGHALGRAVAQATTERLALARAERLSGPQPCPTCGRRCPLVRRERRVETVDGPIELREPVCHCSACRRDFFPSASGVGARPTGL
jgi:anaerobic selenocysteine-containing dehydrogenase